MSFRATCYECSKAYKVPHDRKEWRCKECNGVLSLESDEPQVDAEVDAEADTGDALDSDLGEVACTGCGALNFGEGTFCEECGEELPAMGSGLSRKDAAHDMRKSMKRIRRLKTWVGLNLILAALGTLGLIALLLRTEGLSAAEVALISGLQLLILGLSYGAYRFLDRKPLPIVMGLAALQTLSTIWNYVDGSPWIPTLIWAALLWWLVVDAAHITRLAKEHPDLYLARRMRGEHITHKRGGGRAASSRAAGRGRGSAETNWWVLGGVIVAVLALGVAAFKATSKGGNSATRPTLAAAPAISPRGATEAFKAAWNSHSIDLLATMTKESLREKMRGTLTRLGDRYEWGTQFPQVESAVFEEPKSGSVRVTFPSEAGDFPVRFIFEDDQWLIRSIKTSPLKAWRPE